MQGKYSQIYMSPQIAKRIKIEAVRQGITFKSMVEEACMLYIQLLRSGELKEMIKERDREMKLIELEEIKAEIDTIRSDRTKKGGEKCSKS